MALGFYKSAVLINTVASAVGLTQVYLPGRQGRRPPRDVRPCAVHAVLDGRVHATEAGRLMAVCGEGGKELHTDNSGAENLGPGSRLHDSISHTRAWACLGGISAFLVMSARATLWWVGTVGLKNMAIWCWVRSARGRA